jgi:hypothetical protein
MRRIIMKCAGALALFMGTAFAPPLARAATIAAPAALANAAHETNLVEDVGYVCGWWGPRCWTIGYAYYYRPYYVESPYPYYWAYQHRRVFYRGWGWK